MEIRRDVANDEGECGAAATLQIDGSAGQKLFGRICRDRFHAVPKPFHELGAAAAATSQKEWIDRSSISNEKAGKLEFHRVASACACAVCSYLRLQLRCVGL